MKICVIGGAGYIGSHAVKLLAEKGHEVTCIDNLSNGHAAAVDGRAKFFVADLANTFQMIDIFQRRKIEAIMHFAASAYVGESVTDPRKYYRNNVSNTVSMLDAMHATGIKKLVFSSTCATYGMPPKMPITEDLPQLPINPYGDSKRMVEHMLKDVAKAEGLAFAAPRYFNVAGCSLDGVIGEDHRPETHIIPVLLSVALGKKSHMDLFGTDYPTKDGTCVRDYIHVWDLVEAHLVLLENLQAGKGLFYNLGVGRGYSNREIIQAVERVTGRNIAVKASARRPGDPPELFADPAKIKKELGWAAKITDLDEIVRTAWQWFSKHPNGYAE
ncbi:MAG: UDP-glucose 4-epimerase GalE [Phycisphaerales bacterium]|nr:UDP-glucose 4-epimerase GalE [Phycisphaerales bacterium]